jgi:hypothetical protein
MCPSGATCLTADCCFSELSLYKSNQACWSSTKRTSSSSHWQLTCSRHDIAENCWVKEQSLNHSHIVVNCEENVKQTGDLHIGLCDYFLTFGTRKNGGGEIDCGLENKIKIKSAKIITRMSLLRNFCLFCNLFIYREKQKQIQIQKTYDMNIQFYRQKTFNL